MNQKNEFSMDEYRTFSNNQLNHPPKSQVGLPPINSTVPVPQQNPEYPSPNPIYYESINASKISTARTPGFRDNSSSQDTGSKNRSNSGPKYGRGNPAKSLQTTTKNMVKNEIPKKGGIIRSTTEKPGKN